MKPNYYLSTAIPYANAAPHIGYALEALYADYGRTASVPTLWLYSENDAFWGKDIPHAWFAAFTAQGGKGRFVQLPAVHNAGAGGGHAAFTRIQSEWQVHVDRFLNDIGFTTP